MKHRGYVHRDFAPVADVLVAQLARRRAGGGAVCVYHRGERVVDVWAGCRNEADEPWEEDTLSLSFSTTKGVVSTLLHVLVDRGRLRYDDRVADHWPAFAQGGKETITVRDVLAHQAGLYGLRGIIDHAERILDWRHMTETLAAAHPKERRAAYHAITYGWLVGEIVRRVTKQTVAEALRTELGAPLATDGLYIGGPVSERARIASLVLPTESPGRRAGALRGRTARLLGRLWWAALGLDPARTKDAMLPHGARRVFYSPRLLDAEVPSMNGVFTARALARMYAMLASGGKIERSQIVSPDTVREATRIQSRSLDLVIGFPMRWRLGYHLVGTTRGVLPKAFGHFGFGGSGAWADPERNLAVAMTLNRIAGTPFGDFRMIQLGGVAARCAERR